jgi:hypothetical protein
MDPKDLIKPPPFPDKKNSWSTLTTPIFIAFAICSILLLIIIANDADQFIPILDDANLAFHEAGHPIFGILGSTLGLYGGTLGQLVFPIVVMVTFWRKKESIGFAVGSIWLFQNFLNIARYMADARAHVLPLVGSGEHDWTQIFSRWGVLPHDIQIAGFLRTVGWLGMLTTVGWITWRWWFTDRHTSN